jgi:thiol-disulfide isomerase/thioredoxin
MFNFTKTMCLGMILITSSAFAKDNQYRAYIATRLAKIVMVNDTPEEVVVEEMCDGSGWITHGDGHKTKCPGCSACQKRSTDEVAVAEDGKEDKYYLYHFGATWCGPCQNMIRNTWSNKKVKEFLQQKNTKLFILDADEEVNKKFFNYYKVSSYPTIILIKADDAKNVLSKTVGYEDAENMIKILDEKL